MSLALMNEIRELKQRVSALEATVQRLMDPLARPPSPEPPKKPDTLTLDKRKS